MKLFFKIINYDLPHVDPVPRDRDESDEYRQLESRKVSEKLTFSTLKIKFQVLSHVSSALGRVVEPEPQLFALAEPEM